MGPYDKFKTATPIRKQLLGARILDGNACSFLVWAPHAARVEISIIDPQNRDILMRSVGGDYFHAVVEGVSAGALYRYRLDNDKERPDPASRYQPQGVHGPSQVVDDRFDWSDSDWRGLPLEKYVFYELHTGAFTPQGTFEAIIPRLPALKDLGVTAIELMPVAQFPGSRNWGYDGVYPYAVQASYGGPGALKAFVNACHHQGLAVVLDVVYNHLGPEGNYLADFGPYFTDFYKTPWGQAVNFDRAGSDEVRRYFIENALQWVTDFHIDALRLDAIHAIVDSSAQTFLEELGAAVHAGRAEVGRDAHLIAESNRNDPRVVSPIETGGLGLDAVWNDDFHHALHVLLTGERNGYYADYSGIEDLAGSYRDGFLYAQRYSTFRQKRYGKSSKEIPSKRFVVFSQNHDQVGNRRLGDRLSRSLSVDQLKLAAGTVLLSPCLPLLFMGEEYGETASFQYFVSHEDPSLVAAVRQGRRSEFARFGWTGDIPDPEDESTFRRSKLNWDLQTASHHRLLRHFYRELLRLRREVPALTQLDKNGFDVSSFADSKVLLVKRGIAGRQVLMVYHFDHYATELTLPIPPGRWRRMLDSGEERWGDQQKEDSPVFQSQGEVRFFLSPWRFLVFVQTAEDSDPAP
ncbi:MAG: malto-oligosyltrehalose trehalohydrolase [Candidatus Acidiferrales bacterium]